MRKIVLVSAALLLTLGCSELQQMANQYQAPADQTASAAPTQTEITAGLKDALRVGIAQAVAASSAQDGFYGNSLIKIPIPAEADAMTSTLRSLGMGRMVDDFEISLNRAAEQASGQATSIFATAITEMTIVDVVDVWQGQDDAATQYLKRSSGAELEQAFAPIIAQAIDTAGVARYWQSLATAYNSVPFVSPVTPDLNQYVNDKTMDGLFTLVAQEEKKIRDNPAARSTDILQRVFGYSQQYATH